MDVELPKAPGDRRALPEEREALGLLRGVFRAIPPFGPRLHLPPLPGSGNCSHPPPGPTVRGVLLGRGRGEIKRRYWTGAGNELSIPGLLSWRLPGHLALPFPALPSFSLPLPKITSGIVVKSGCALSAPFTLLWNWSSTCTFPATDHCQTNAWG